MDERLRLDGFVRAAGRTTRRELLKRTVFGLSGAAAFTLLAACGGGGSSTEPARSGTGGAPAGQGTASVSQPSGTTGEGEPKRGGTLITMGHTDVAGLSPEDASPTVEWSLVVQIHNSLLQVDENYELQPLLAERYEAAESGLEYTFTLRKGVKFHDGQEFTAEDAKYTYEWYMNPDNTSTSRTSFAGVKSIDAKDNYTVVVTMSEPNAAFLIRAATTFILPARYHREVGQEKYRTAPIGTGAFKLKEWRSAEYTLLEAFEDHFRGRPYLDAYRLNVVPEPSVRAIALETGEADTSVWQLAVDDNLKFEQSGNFTIFKAPSVSVNHFPLNNNRPQLADKAVRQAMMYAIDREAVINDIFRGTAVLATANLAPVLTFWYNKDVKQYPYDPEQAKKILDDAGWKAGAGGVREKNGTKLSFTVAVITGDQARRPEAEVVQQYLQAVGIEMKIIENPDTSGGMRRDELDAALYNWTYGGSGGEPDASVTLRSDGFNNFSKYKNPRMDELLAAGLKEVDRVKRKTIYDEVQKIVAEDVPFLYMMYWQWYTVFSKRVKGLPKAAKSPTATYQKAHTFWLSEA